MTRKFSDFVIAREIRSTRAFAILLTVNVPEMKNYEWRYFQEKSGWRKKSVVKKKKKREKKIGGKKKKKKKKNIT